MPRRFFTLALAVRGPRQQHRVPSAQGSLPSALFSPSPYLPERLAHNGCRTTREPSTWHRVCRPGRAIRQSRSPSRRHALCLHYLADSDHHLCVIPLRSPAFHRHLRSACRAASARRAGRHFRRRGRAFRRNSPLRTDHVSRPYPGSGRVGGCTASPRRAIFLSVRGNLYHARAGRYLSNRRSAPDRQSRTLDRDAADWLVGVLYLPGGTALLGRPANPGPGGSHQRTPASRRLRQ